MIVDETILAMVAEWHDDFIVIRTGETPQLVSVKHRELSQGPWSLRDLILDGGVKHLFQQWTRLNRLPECKVVTNGALKRGKNQSRQFINAVQRRDWAWVRAAHQLRKYLPVFNEDDLLAFLKGLTVESETASRHHIRSSNIEGLLRPALRTLGLNEDRAEDAYDDLLQLIEGAIRGGVGSKPTRFDLLLHPNRLELAVARQQAIAKRTVMRQDTLSVVAQACSSTGALLSSPSEDATDATKLVRKLRTGGLGPTTINSAKRLRAIWSSLEARYRSDLPTVHDQIHDLRTRVLDIAADAQSVARRGREDLYGPQMLDELKRTLLVPKLGSRSPFPLDDKHLLGLVYQLTDECEVWWSDQHTKETNNG